MNKYKLQLVKNEMNLLDKCCEVKEVIDYIGQHGEDGANFLNVKHIELITISQNYLEIEVDESDSKWHKYVGRILANNHGMRDYCNPNDDSEMFKWI